MFKVLNKIKGYISFNYGFIKSWSKPAIYAIETSNICNLKCVMCPRSKMTRKIGNIDKGLFIKAIDECKDNTSFIWLQGMGEPLIDKNIFELISYTHKNGVRVGVSTNATMLNEEKARQLLKSELDYLMLCLDGINKETYEKIRVNAEFDSVIKNIEQFLELKHKLGCKKPYAVLQIIEMNTNKSQLEEMKHKWEMYPSLDEIIVKGFRNWGGQLNEYSKIGVPEYKKRNELKRPPCSLLWHSVALLQDGTVSVCCKDFDGKIALGNLNNESLDSIWNGKKMLALREMHVRGNFPIEHLCHSCMEYPPIYPSRLLLNVPNIKFTFKKLKDSFKGMGL